jgi:hypothetical protein
MDISVLHPQITVVNGLEEQMKAGLASMVWIKDKNGKEYVCCADDLKGNI